ncbi:MAG: hypothetical protein ACRDWI_20305 [Jiangellaceae bacterium]
MTGRRLRLAMAAAAAATLVAALLGIGVRATFGGHAAVDEPQYLLTALSLWEDHDLDIADELADQRYRDFFDAELPVQTSELPDGTQRSPHDPLLALLLAAPMGLAGWVGAKVALAVLAASTSALLVWVAVRRFDVPAVVAGVGAALAGASPPLAVYGQQVYPELPAALALLAGVALATGPLRRPGLIGLGLAVTALPWLGVKYLPVAAALAVVVLVRLVRSGRAGAAGRLGLGLAAAGAFYLVVHRLVWGGWTVYATGDHFEPTGEFSVVGVEPDYVGRSLRLVGLLVDRAYGLVSWQPAWLLAVPAVGALLAWRRGAGGRLDRAAVVVPLLAGWAVATWPALTMHGYWWPGRQVVVVLPLAALVVLWWLGRVVPRLQALGAALAAFGLVHLGALLLDGWAREITWVVGFEAVDDPVHQALRPLFPDYRAQGPGFWPLHIGWVAAVLVLLVVGARSARLRRPQVGTVLQRGFPSHDSLPFPRGHLGRRHRRRPRARPGRVLRRRRRLRLRFGIRLGLRFGLGLGLRLGLGVTASALPRSRR